MTHRLSRRQARNQAVEVGKFPPRHADDWVYDVAEPSPAQLVAIGKLSKRIGLGEISIVRGRMGAGKTWIATLFAFKWYERGYNRERGKARYWTLTGLLNEQKSWYGMPESKRSDEPMQLAKACGLLVIDELVAQAESFHDQTQLRDLIDQRYRDKKATLILTNLEGDGLLGALDTPTLDRACECDGEMVIELAGESMRGVSA